MKALRLRAFPSAFPGTASETPKLIPGWGWRCSALRPARNTGGLRPHWGNWERWSPPGLSGGSARRFGFRRCPLRPWGMWGRSVGSRCLCKSLWGPAVLPYGLSGFVAEVWARGSALFCFELRFPPLFSVPESLLPSFPGSSARRWGAGGLWGLQFHPRNELHSKSFSRGSGIALGWGGLIYGSSCLSCGSNRPVWAQLWCCRALWGALGACRAPAGAQKLRLSAWPSRRGFWICAAAALFGSLLQSADGVGLILVNGQQRNPCSRAAGPAARGGQGGSEMCWGGRTLRSRRGWS